MAQVKNLLWDRETWKLRFVVRKWRWLVRNLAKEKEQKRYCGGGDGGGKGEEEEGQSLLICALEAAESGQ